MIPIEWQIFLPHWNSVEVAIKWLEIIPNVVSVSNFFFQNIFNRWKNHKSMNSRSWNLSGDSFSSGNSLKKKNSHFAGSGCERTKSTKNKLFLFSLSITAIPCFFPHHSRVPSTSLRPTLYFFAPQAPVFPPSFVRSPVFAPRHPSRISSARKAYWLRAICEIAFINLPEVDFYSYLIFSSRFSV